MSHHYELARATRGRSRAFNPLGQRNIAGGKRVPTPPTFASWSWEPDGLARKNQHGAPGWHAQPHARPIQARRPSTTAQPAIPSATTPSSHQTPHSVLAASPANTAIAR